MNSNFVLNTFTEPLREFVINRRAQGEMWRFAKHVLNFPAQMFECTSGINATIQ